MNRYFYVHHHAARRTIANSGVMFSLDGHRTYVVLAYSKYHLARSLQRLWVQRCTSYFSHCLSQRWNFCLLNVPHDLIQPGKYVLILQQRTCMLLVSLKLILTICPDLAQSFILLLCDVLSYYDVITCVISNLMCFSPLLLRNVTVTPVSYPPRPIERQNLKPSEQDNLYPLDDVDYYGQI